MRAEWRLAFGDTDDRLAPTLLWHFSAWSLKCLCNEKGYSPDRIFTPGTYRNVAIVMVDIFSFSSYVRDTRNEALVRARSRRSTPRRARRSWRPAGVAARGVDRRRARRESIAPDVRVTRRSAPCDRASA